MKGMKKVKCDVGVAINGVFVTVSLFDLKSKSGKCTEGILACVGI